jgi:hypothetical protein
VANCTIQENYPAERIALNLEGPSTSHNLNQNLGMHWLFLELSRHPHSLHPIHQIVFYSKLLFPDLLKCCIEPVGATSQVKIKPAKGPHLPEKCPGRPPDAKKYTEEIYILCGHTNLETWADVGAHCMYKQHPSLWVSANKNELLESYVVLGMRAGGRQVTQVNEDGRHTAWMVWASRLCVLCSCCSAGGCFERRGIT